MQPNESNEIIFIALRALEYQGKYQEALAFINTHTKLIVDNIAKHDFLGRIHHNLGN